MKFIFGIILFIPLVMYLCILGYRGMSYDMNCGGYLSQAAAASTVESAKPPLKSALKFLEDHKMTSGNTGIFFSYPQNDVGFFYNNLKSASVELSTITPETPPLVQSNVLMKLHEAIHAHSPEGISMYPYNVISAIAGLISMLLAFIGIVVILIFVDKY